ncbi:hypothetical protein VPH35_024441 [Triticum aestivum]
MAARLAPVPELSTDEPAAATPYLPCSLYRDWIRSVAVSGAQMRSTVFSMSQSGDSGSSYSSHSSYSNYSSASSRSAGADADDFGANELTKIAHQMVSDGYTQRMLQAFVVASSPALDRALENRLSGIELYDVPSPVPALGNGGGPNTVLETWFCELDVGWVLQICQERGSQWQFRLQDKSASSLQDLVERWIRGLTVIVHSLTELVSNSVGICVESMATERFGKASISKMLVFVEAIMPDLKAEKLQAVLDMYTCVSNALHMLRSFGMSTRNQQIFSAACDLLSTQGDMLWEAISSTMEEMRALVEGDDDLWAMEIKHGGGEVHNNTHLVVSSILSMKKTVALMTGTFTWLDYDYKLDRNIFIGVLIDETVYYLNDLLLRKSELCLDPSLRYLFLLNNSYFVVSLNLHLPWWYQRSLIFKLAPECKKYMDSYLDVSWGHVLSCIPKSNFNGPLQCWKNTSSLAKFESAFHKTYQAQKF